MSGSKGGKTTVVILVLVIIILFSGIAISLFLLNKETQIRKDTEVSLEQVRTRGAKIEAALQDAEKQIEVLKGKNKDADDKINSLMEEIDLDAALREEIKAESKKLKETLEAEGKAKVELRQKLLGDLEAVQAKLKDAEARAEGQVAISTELKKKIDELQQKNDTLEQKVKDVEAGLRASRNEILPAPGQEGSSNVDLDRIVVTPEEAKSGRILNVDTETEFIIFDIGTKNGVKQGDVMSVYRGKTYLGDVKVSRVQDEMSAADLVPPFSSRKVRKNDQVVPKR